MAIVQGYATKQFDATDINALKAHAINTETVKPLCSDKLNVLCFTPALVASTGTVSCLRCLKKLAASA
jgi:hypothetical protein